jgi:hypothetical protein
MKEKLKSYIFFLLSMCCLFGLGNAPTIPNGCLEKTEKTICNRSQSKCFLVCHLFSENTEIGANSQKKDNFFDPLVADFTHFVLSPFRFFSNLLFLNHPHYNLSYWGQKIQILSSRSHPPSI